VISVPGTWVFGYGSLVSAASVARTIGRSVDADVDLHVTRLNGFGRRWNYGSLHLRGDWEHDGRTVTSGLVVSLGLVEADDETCNGTVVRVTDDELAALDWRERDYERTDVTDLIEADRRFAGPVVTYVPRPSAIDRYLTARDSARAAVRRSYWYLVHETFEHLGPDHLDEFVRTPPPDVPVVDIDLTSNSLDLAAD
jgi:dephospho-CoA kinase